MLIIIKLIRTYIGGKTEFGLLLASLLSVAYVLPVWSWLTMDVYVSLIAFIGTFTGTAFLSRIEDQNGLGKAFKSLLNSLQKAFKKKK